jgi:hypothetical protein
VPGARESATQRVGNATDANDVWSASTAIAAGMEVLAVERDLERIPGLRRTTIPKRVSGTNSRGQTGWNQKATKGRLATLVARVAEG